LFVDTGMVFKYRKLLRLDWYYRVGAVTGADIHPHHREHTKASIGYIL
jgi:hypothetical protein